MAWICPVCNLDSERIFQVRGEYWVRGCEHCGHRFVEWSPPPEHVAGAFGDAYFTGGGPGYSNYCSESALLRSRGVSYSRVLAKYGKATGTLLDVGAAAGFISDGFRSQGWLPEGLEPNQQMVSYGRTQLGLQVHWGTLESFRSSKLYDVISLIQVVQHFADVQLAMKAAADHTQPGGFCLIETWDSRSFSARFFGQRWHGYNPPTVLHYFNPRSLAHLCEQFGLLRVAAGRPARHITGAHAKSLLHHHLGHRLLGHALDFIPNRMAIRYPGDDLFWMLFQKPAQTGLNRTVADHMLTNPKTHQCRTG